MSFSTQFPPFLWPGQNGKISYISAAPTPSYLEKPVRNLAILGSTGSIGRNALDVASSLRESIRITALAGGRNMELLAAQATLWQPPYLAVLDAGFAQKLARLLPKGYQPEILHGKEGYATLASLPEADCVLSAQSGASGLCGTLAAALAGKVIALANKESLVNAGALLRRICARTKASILPVDSEHYAIFQCAAGHHDTGIKNLVLTASGGPFLGKKAMDISQATPAAALKHPNWSMGAKISIDSATLMNKGLELIEAMHLYGIGADSIKIVIHPQSIVHSMVEFADNSLLAQLAVPDMRLALGGCLGWPAANQPFIRPLDLAGIGQLTFLEPDYETFRCPALALAAANAPIPAEWRQTGLNPACIALNSANEAAVELFLAGKCRFGEIPRLVEFGMSEGARQPPGELAEPADTPVPACAVQLAGCIKYVDSVARDSVRIAMKMG